MIYLPFIALLSPFVVFFVEQLLPYPYIIEELLKAGVIYYLISHSTSFKLQLKTASAFALLFTFAETVFFSFNIISTGQNLFIQRLVFTGALHLTTTVILLLTFRQNKFVGLLGLITAVLAHFIYNFSVGSL